MREWQSQTHMKWYCRYHVVIVPKYRRKSMFGAIRREVGLDEAMIRDYIRTQEEHGKKEEQIQLDY
jgi:REP element-mobilizing transposase RayT